MSSNLLHVLFNTQNIHCAKQFGVNTGREAIAAWLTGMMNSREWSTYDVAKRSGSFKLANGTVWNVQNCRIKDVRENTLRGLAKAFDVPPAEVFAIYRGKPEEMNIDELRLIEYFKALPTERKNDALRYLEMLYREYGAAPKSRVARAAGTGVENSPDPVKTKKKARS